jgi:hypothetical protein
VVLRKERVNFNGYRPTRRPPGRRLSLASGPVWSPSCEWFYASLACRAAGVTLSLTVHTLTTLLISTPSVVSRYQAGVIRMLITVFASDTVIDRF